MRGMSAPSAILISPLLFARAGEFKRHPYDVRDAAKKLLAEAGYPNGFEVAMDCPNDRYVNDEAICQAVAAMLARVGVKVHAQRQPKAQVLREGGTDRRSTIRRSTCSAGRRARSTRGTCSPTSPAAATPPARAAQFNYGGYCNPKVDALADKILVESDTEKRDDLIARGVQDRARGGRHHPAAPADARLGRVEEDRDRAAGGQPDPVLLGQEGVGDDGREGSVVSRPPGMRRD